MRSPFVGGVPSPAPLEWAGTEPSRAGPYFFEEIGERTPRGRRFLPLGTPFSGGGTGEGGWVGMGLACGLQDQRLMARPPARAGGRGGSLTGGKVGNGMVFLLPFPKGTCSRPQPAQPVGGPLRAFQCEGRRPGNQREVQLPPTQPHQRRESRGKNLFPLGFFPPFLPKKWGPGWETTVPRRSNGVGKTHNTPNPLKNAPSSLARPERGRIVSS